MRPLLQRQDRIAQISFGQEVREEFHPGLGPVRLRRGNQLHVEIRKSESEKQVNTNTNKQTREKKHESSK